MEDIGFLNLDLFATPHNRNRCYKNVFFSWGMLCGICNNEKSDLTTECGHSYHTDCFQKNWSHCTLPCVQCRTPLAIACWSEKDCVVGVKTAHSMCCCYKLVDNKIVRHTNLFRKWERWNGRLRSCQMTRLKFNICVT